jgi:hypothetical protein
VKNTGNVTLTGVDVADDVLPGLIVVCPGDGDGDDDVIASLAPGAEVSCTTSYTLTAADIAAGAVGNQAFACDLDPTKLCDDGETETKLPSVELTKSASPSTRAEPGGEFTFTLTIVNTSTEAVDITGLTDSQSAAIDFSDCTALIGKSLDASDGLPGGDDEVTCTYTITHTDVGTYDNTAKVVVTDEAGLTAEDTDAESVTVTDVKPSVDLTKTASPASQVEPGGSFEFTLTIWNTSPEEVSIVSLVDDSTLSAACTALIGQKLAATDASSGGADTASCTYTVTHTNAGEYKNEAMVTVKDDEDNDASDKDDETVTVTDLKPKITVTKTANPTAVPSSGGNVTYTISVKNETAEAFVLSDLQDDKFGDVDSDPDDSPGTAAVTPVCGGAIVPLTIAANATFTCTFTKFVTGAAATSHVNIATACGGDDDGNSTCDDDDATVAFSWRGRTPGYWKRWTKNWPTGYSPDMILTDVGFVKPSCISFDQVRPDGTDKLLQALSYQGGSTLDGKAQILLRAAVAALLNEATFGNDFPPYGTTTELITAVNTALASCDGNTMTTLAAVLDGWNNGVH